MTVPATSTEASGVLRAMLRVLPDDHLLPRAPAFETSALLAENEAWLREQIRLRGYIWGIDDQFVLGTLWWYSASNWLVMPTVTSWFVTGTALSARLQDVLLFHRPDSRIPGSRSLQLGPPSLDQLGAQLRESLGQVITAVALITGRGERRLWSFAVDAIVGRILWAAQQTGRVDEVQQQASELVAAIDPDLPRPRLTIVEPSRAQSGERRLHVRRGSCCLLYRVPGEAKCGTCPRQPPHERLRRLAGH